MIATPVATHAFGTKALVRALAKAGRGNDRLIAHISPREAKILKAAGGSGTVNPNTGIMEFDDSGFDFSFDNNNDYTSGADYSLAPSGSSLGLSPTPGTDSTGNEFSLAPSNSSFGLTAGGGTGFQTPQSAPTNFWNTPSGGGSFTPAPVPALAPAPAPAPAGASSGNAAGGLSFGSMSGTGLNSSGGTGLSFSPALSSSLMPSTTPSATSGLSTAIPAAVSNPTLGLTTDPNATLGSGEIALGSDPSNTASNSQPSFLSSLGKGLSAALSNPAVLARLLGGGLAGGAAAVLSNHAQAAASQQAQGYQTDYNRIAAPLVSGGYALINQGRQGGLTPVQMQQLAAERARGMQQLAKQGISSGTAVQQLDAIIQNQAQQFSQNLVNQGLQQVQLGDQYAAQAIQALYQGNTQANQLASQFAGQLGQILAGAFGAGGSVGVNSANTGANAAAPNPAV